MSTLLLVPGAVIPSMVLYKSLLEFVLLYTFMLLFVTLVLSPTVRIPCVLAIDAPLPYVIEYAGPYTVTLLLSISTLDPSLAIAAVLPLLLYWYIVLFII